jgi:formylglycine-generating enzyme required for sulfatase activity
MWNMMHRCVLFFNRAPLLLFLAAAAASCGGNGNGNEDVRVDTDADWQDADAWEDADAREDEDSPDVPEATDTADEDEPSEADGEDPISEDIGPDEPDAELPVVPGTWVLVPAGVFMMGSPDSEPCREPWTTILEDLHEVTLDRDIEMLAYEVTQAQFEEVMGYNPSTWSGCGPTCPVENVNWYQAAAYCNALSRLAGLDECYACTGVDEAVVCETVAAYDPDIYACPGYRLPTEAEWEHAYRSGTSSALYNGELDLADCDTCGSSVNAEAIGWYCSNSGSTTHPVGQKLANDLGFHDMAGNVNELLNDWMTYGLGTDPVTNPTGPLFGSVKAIRGGSAWSLPVNLRAANRDSVEPDGAGMNLGIRPCRTLP